jgi:hypothetical protein
MREFFENAIQTSKEMICVIVSHDLLIWRDEYGRHAICNRCGWNKLK